MKITKNTWYLIGAGAIVAYFLFPRGKKKTATDSTKSFNIVGSKTAKRNIWGRAN